MRIHNLSRDLSIIDVDPPIPGWSEFVGLYVLGKEQVALIDAGPRCSAGAVIDGLEALGIERERVGHVALTHIHIDHAGAAGELMQLLPNARVVVHPRGASHLANTARLWEESLKTLGDLAEQQGRPADIAPDRILSAEEGAMLRVGGQLELEVLHTPGHAVHHMSFFDRRGGRLFAGEAGGAYSPMVNVLRPATPPPLSLEQYLESIDRLLQLDAAEIYYAHYGQGGTAPSRLQQHKEQIQLWRAVISEALDDTADCEGIFARLVAEDANLAGLKGLPEEQYRREHYFMVNAIRGFVGYIERQKA